VFRPAPLLQTLLAAAASIVFVATGQLWPLAVIWPVAALSWLGWWRRRTR
jgi:hypothetical protein